MLIGIIGWVIVGLLAGFIASKFVNLRGDEPGIGIAVAAGAALVGGGLFSAISGSAVSAFNVWSILFAVLAAVVAMLVWHVVRHRISSPRKARRSW
jgi:uncharacterized membrane protein YeaQ/YmgE (transglycosylase-associated protein family)